MNRLNGLIAAAFTPLASSGNVELDRIPDMVNRLIDYGINGFYVCGSTGEGLSLTRDERRQVAEAFVDAVGKRVPVIVQIGHNSLKESQQLAAHARSIGADAISANAPSYFNVSEIQTLVECMATVATGAPDLPFYYYHIPELTGANLNMVEFLERGAKSIPNLVGLKFTDTKVHEYQQCVELNNGQFDVVYGYDEMLLPALVVGARAAIGSTFNVAAPLYHRILNAFELGDLEEARKLQALAIQMTATLHRFPFHPAMKTILSWQGLDIGDCRLPHRQLTAAEVEELWIELARIGFFEWCGIGSEFNRLPTGTAK